MARKPCAQNVAQLDIDCSFACLPTGRFRRIAQNAILPFYYDCSVPGADINNKSGTCKKVFYIKNPKFFSGAAANNPGSQVTQAMRYANLARTSYRIVDGRRSTQIIRQTAICENTNNINWYNEPRETELFNLQKNQNHLLLCPNRNGRNLRN